MTQASLTETGPADAGPAEQSTVHPPLRRNEAFQTLWAGSVASTLGLSVADVTYPLAILGVTRSPRAACSCSTCRLRPRC